MKNFKRLSAIIMSLIILATVFGGCANSNQTSTPDASASQTPETSPDTSSTPTPSSENTTGEKLTVRIAALKGPTGIGMAKLMEDSAENNTTNNYVFELSGAPNDIAGMLTSQSIDIAAVPTNLAATLYNKTSGKIQIAALNTLGTLYVIEDGDSIESISDLKGKTITATGQGATPEYALNYILEQNGLITDKDVTVNYLSEHSELATLVVAGKEKLALLPEPFVTTVLTKKSNLRIALDLTAEWQEATKKTDNDAELSVGCIVVRKEFAEQNKAAVNAFLEEYKASIEFANLNVDEASQMVQNQGIMPDAEIVMKAIPNCNIVYIDGDDMKNNTKPFLEILMEANPKSIGGKLPNEDFYYAK